MTNETVLTPEQIGTILRDKGFSVRYSPAKNIVQVSLNRRLTYDEVSIALDFKVSTERFTRVTNSTINIQ